MKWEPEALKEHVGKLIPIQTRKIYRSEKQKSGALNSNGEEKRRITLRCRAFDDPQDKK